MREFDEAGFTAHFEGLPTDAERLDLLEHAYAWGGRVVMILDEGKFWNHSTSPNTGMVAGAADGNSTYALRDIAAGEELLDDYLKYEELLWFDALVEKHGAWVPAAE